MRILLTGATGFLGRRIGARLTQAGHGVIILSRDAERARRSLPYTCTGAFNWNPTEERPPVAAFADVDAVVHLAGEPIADGRWTEARKQRIRDSRVLGTRHLLDAIAELPKKPGVLVGASAVGIYGDRGDEQLKESSAAASDFLAKVTRDWETELFRPLPGTNLRRVALRIGFVLGPEGGALKALLPMFRAGLGSKLGSGQQWVSWVHADDVAGLAEFALTHATAEGPINAVAPNPVRQGEFARELASTLKRPLLLKAPAFALKLALGSEMAGALLGGQHVSAAKAAAAGYRFRYDRLDAALRSLLK